MIDPVLNISKLKNGLRVLSIPTTKFNSVFVMLTGKVGRRSENKEETGAAHFLEHLLFDGTVKRPSAIEINRLIEDVGGSKNGITWQETVDYFVKVIPEQIDVAFDYVSDIVQHSLFNEKDVGKEKKVITQEAIMKNDDPDDLLYRLHQGQIYPNQKMGQSIIDEWHVIDKLSSSIIKKFWKKNYIAANFVLTVVGNTPNNKVERLASQYFSTLPIGNENRFPQAQIEPNQTTVIKNTEFDQSKLAISFPGLNSSSNEMYAARMLAIILGVGFSSRLYNKLRNDLHLVYHIQAGNIDFSDSGYFKISTKLSENNVQQAVDKIFSELRQISDNLILDWELARAKNRLISWFLFEMEKSYFFADHFANQILFQDEIEPISNILKYIENLTTQDIQRTARHIFRNQPKITLLTPSLSKIDVNWN